MSESDSDALCPFALRAFRFNAACKDHILCSPGHGYKLVRQGHLKITKSGTRTLVTGQQIIDCIASLKKASDEERVTPSADYESTLSRRDERVRNRRPRPKAEAAAVNRLSDVRHG